MAKLTLEEKRLRALKLQLFGKEQNIKSVPHKTSEKSHFDLTPKEEIKSSGHALNLNYIHGDLLKILVLVAMAVSFQLALYFATTHNIIKLSLF